MSIGRLFFQTKVFQIKDFIKNCTKKTYTARDLAVEIFYLILAFFSNPYRKCRKSGLGPYGETPLSALEKISEKIALTKEDSLFDLGCGRGKHLFWLSNHYSCRITGYEKVKFFVKSARFITKILRKKQLRFVCEDFVQAPFSEATVVYLYGFYDTKTLDRLVTVMKRLPQGAKVISISFPITINYLRLENSFPVIFPWGRTLAYIQRVDHGKVI
jgi:SAM-dependent methyltransferase